MNKRKTLWNASIAVIQVLISAITLFILYRYLLETLGIEALGIWSVVLASTSLASVSQFGLSGSVTKFIAKYLAKKEIKNVEGVLKTAFFSIGGILLVILPLLYYPLVWVLGSVVPKSEMPTVIVLIPYALISVWLSSLVGVVISGLDGCQRADLRGGIMIFGVILFTGLAILLIPQYSLLGLAYAQIIQNISVLIIGWMMLRKEIHSLLIVPIGWDRCLFKEMIRYGVNFQISSIMIMLFDPITKILMSKFGGLAMTGYFEMANRIVLQFRTIISSANQVLVPVVATLEENNKASPQLKNLYINIFRLVFMSSVIGYSLIALITPYISLVFLGNYESVFVVFILFSLFGWFVNTISVPAYFNNLGTGDLRPNTIGHVVIGAVNAIAGFILGYFFGGVGVIAAYVLALFSGSALIVFFYHKKHNILISDIIEKDLWKLIIGCAFSVMISLLLFYLLFPVGHIVATLLFITIMTLYFSMLFFVLRNNSQFILSMKNIFFRE